MIGTQPRILAASVGMLALALCLLYALLRLISTPWDGMLQFGGSSFSWQFVPLFGAIVLWNLSWIWCVVCGFRIHWAWGLAILILPMASLVFFFHEPGRAKRPIFVWLWGTGFLLIFLISTPGG